MAALPDTLLDRAKQMVMVESDRPHVLREMIYVCRPRRHHFGAGRLWRIRRQASDGRRHE